jgi:hypothetical protein
MVIGVMGVWSQADYRAEEKETGPFWQLSSGHGGLP